MRKQTRLYSLNDISQRKYKTINWEGQWKEAFGCPAINETWFISGASAQGKSSLCKRRRRDKTIVSTKNKDVQYGRSKRAVLCDCKS